MNAIELKIGEAIFIKKEAEIKIPIANVIIVHDNASAKFGVCAFSAFDCKDDYCGYQLLLKILKKLKQEGVLKDNISVFYSLINETENFSVMSNLKKFGIKQIKRTSFKSDKLIFDGKSVVETKNENNESPVEKCELAKIRLYIVDDSKTIRSIIKKMVEKEPSIEVIGEAESADIAESIVIKLEPDVITLDVNMPGTDGVSYLKKIMKTTKTPTIMFTSLNYEESGPVFDALTSGAFEYMKKPALEEIEESSNTLISLIKEAAKSKSKKNDIVPVRSSYSFTKKPKDLHEKIILIGASTGGIEAIQSIITSLPQEIPPILIVQHIPAVFSKGFADRLNAISNVSVKEAEDNDVLVPSSVYIAPGGKHMGIINDKLGKISIKITDDLPVNKFKPSVDYMFKSVANSNIKRKIQAIILTGMGVDGADGLLQLKLKGAETFAQDEASSVVYGMPKAAVELGAVLKTLSLKDIPNEIYKFLEK